MNNGKYVFAQITDFLPRRQFDAIVNKYKGNHYVKHFTCWNHMLCMMFGQLSSRESLSDLVLCIDAHKSKTYHLGLGNNVSKNNLAKANEHRDWRIHAEFAYLLITHARQECLSDDFKLILQGNVYAFDSSVIDLCLNVFWWAKFRKAKGAIKLHTLFDVKTNIPCFVHITEASVHDVNALDELEYEKDSFYVLDKAYVDFKRLYKIHRANAFFVTRAKDNFNFKWQKSRKTNRKKGIICDQLVLLSGFYAGINYPEKMRRIKYYDKETDKTFIFLTNNLELSALDIALLYKYRWRVELFFKWIKQHLKVLTFWGTSENAVKIQVYVAILTYTLVAIIKNKLHSPLSTYEIIQILSISLLDKTPVKELINKPYCQNVKELLYCQLKMF
jgi:hypothetical protein